MARLTDYEFYPSDWKGTFWIAYDAAHWYELPAKPACYAIYLDGKLSYVGQARNLQKRMQSYHIRYRLSDSVSTPWGSYKQAIVKIHFARQFGDWAMREARLIERLQPPLNCLGGGRKRMESTYA
jgi:excinuclease UvrABC nuclease subunit